MRYLRVGTYIAGTSGIFVLVLFSRKVIVINALRDLFLSGHKIFITRFSFRCPFFIMLSAFLTSNLNVKSVKWFYAIFLKILRVPNNNNLPR